MALTVKKKKGLIIPKTPSLILPNTNSIFGNYKNNSHEEIIVSEIKRIVREELGVNNRSAMKRVVFVPIYKSRSGEKEIAKIYLNYKTRRIKKVLDVDDIESLGITLVEFFDYIITNGAKEIQNPTSALEVM